MFLARNRALVHTCSHNIVDISGFGSSMVLEPDMSLGATFESKLQLVPRKYQLELLSQALTRNIIANLETNTGKTLIAVLLIKEKAPELTKGRKKCSVFLAPQTALVQQQGDYLMKGLSSLDLKVGVYIGGTTSGWRKKRWVEEFHSHHVLVMTPAIFRNNLQHAFFSIQDFNLIVFDEAHHAVKDDVYNCIMQEFYHPFQDEEERPHIFGMTASPVNSKTVGRSCSGAAIEALSMQLEANLDAKIITIRDRKELDAVAPQPTLITKEYEKGINTAAVDAVLERLEASRMALYAAAQAMSNHKDEVRQSAAKQLLPEGLIFDRERHSSPCLSMFRYLSSIQHIFQELGPWCAVAAFHELVKPAKLVGPSFSQAAVDEQAEAAQPMSWLLDEEGMAPLLQPLGEASEQQSIAAALKEHVAIFADVLVTDAARRAELLAELEPDKGSSASAGQVAAVQRAAAGVLAAIPQAVLTAEVMGEPTPEAEAQRALRGCPLVTPKITALATELRKFREESTRCSEAVAGRPAAPWSCIIFVQRKLAALALHAVISRTGGLDFLASAPLMGHGGKLAATSFKPQLQAETLRLFQAGALNTLVATSVAEEGLDLRQCHLGVRFDLPETHLRFIQSRGRARVHGAHMLCLVERGNAEHAEIVDSFPIYVAQLQELGELRARDEVLADSEWYNEEDSDADAEEAALLSQGGLAGPLEYGVPSTGAKVTLQSACQLLYSYCASLPHDSKASLKPWFRTSDEPAGGAPRFRTLVVLPGNSPVRTAEGHPQQRHRTAMKSACLEACRLLHEVHALDDHLVPDRSDEEAEARERAAAGAGTAGAGTEKDRTLIELRCKVPELLNVAGEAGPAEANQAPAGPQAPLHAAGESRRLHLYAFHLTPPPGQTAADIPELRQPLGLLLLRKLPALLPFSVILYSGSTAEVRLVPCGERSVSPADPLLLQRFHAAATDRARPGNPFCRWGLPEGWAWDRPPPPYLPQLQPDEGLGYEPDAVWAARSAGAWYILAPLMFGEAPGEDAFSGPAAVPEGVPPADFVRLLAADLDHGSLKEAQDGYRSLEKAVIASQLYKQPEAVERAVQERICITRYNGWMYLPERLRPDIRPGSAMLDVRRRKRPKSAAEPGQSSGAGSGSGSGSLDVLLPFLRDEGGADGWGSENEEDNGGDEDDDDEEAAEAEEQAEFARSKRSYQDYYLKKYGIEILFKQQCLLQVRKASKHRRTVAPGRETLLVPELCLLHPMARPLWQRVWLLPQLAWHTHAQLLADELRGRLFPPDALPAKWQPGLPLMVEALTTRACKLPLSYERLETLGDSVLKFAVSLELFQRHPLKHEGQLTARKMRKISNEALSRLGGALGLAAYVQLPVKPSERDPLGVTANAEKCKMTPKVLADVVEALIGAVFVAAGREGAAAAQAFMRHIGILEPDIKQQPGQGEAACPVGVRNLDVPEAAGTASTSAGQLEGPEAVLGYRFRRRELAREALTHCSWPNPALACYQRLEFLGDAVLEVMVSRHLYETYSTMAPGMFTDLRSAMVNNDRLACVCVLHRLHRAMLQFSAPLVRDVGLFVGQLQQAVAAERQGQPKEDPEAAPGGIPAPDSRERRAVYEWAGAARFGQGSVRAPKVLADLVESLTAAVFLDADEDLDATWQVVRPLMEPMVTPETLTVEPVRELHERGQRGGWRVEYRVEEGGDGGAEPGAVLWAVVDGVKLGRCTGARSKRDAQKVAAQDALSRWAQLEEARQRQHVAEARLEAVRHLAARGGGGGGGGGRASERASLRLQVRAWEAVLEDYRAADRALSVVLKRKRGCQE